MEPATRSVTIAGIVVEMTRIRDPFSGAVSWKGDCPKCGPHHTVALYYFPKSGRYRCYACHLSGEVTPEDAGLDPLENLASERSHRIRRRTRAQIRASREHWEGA